MLYALCALLTFAAASGQCPAGWYEREGQNYDADHTTYTIDMAACAEACTTGLPTTGGRQPRECHSFQWSPSVTAGNLGQCWRFFEAAPTEQGNRGPDFKFCSDEAPATSGQCPAGWYEHVGQNFDAEHTTYTLDMAACADACTT